ncbi:uncharacterized protein TNCV_4821501 [Trichonephila clavipes]|nr:uncharacterized protein TNCV_4821501 [Trichonephila clavipes]
MAALVSEYTLEFFTLLNARSKKELIEWCMKERLIASSYECPECNEQMGLNERKSVVLDGFEWRCRKKDLSKLKKKRTAVRSMLTKLINKIEETINNENEPVGPFEAFLEQFNDKENNLNFLSGLIEDLLSVDTFTEDMEASEEIEEIIF